MKKFFLISVVTLLVLSQYSFAQVKPGNTFLGPKVALGGVGKASLGYGLNAEYLLSNNLGVGFTGMYSGYSEDYNFFGASGTWSYSNIYIMGMVTYHFDVFGSPSFDTYGAFNLGYNVASASWKWNNNPYGAPQPASASVGGLVWGFSATMRYFVSSSLALTASAGYGLGYLQVGVDFKL